MSDLFIIRNEAAYFTHSFWGSLEYVDIVGAGRSIGCRFSDLTGTKHIYLSEPRLGQLSCSATQIITAKNIPSISLYPLITFDLSYGFKLGSLGCPECSEEFLAQYPFNVMDAISLIDDLICPDFPNLSLYI